MNGSGSLRGSCARCRAGADLARARPGVGEGVRDTTDGGKALAGPERRGVAGDVTSAVRVLLLIGLRRRSSGRESSAAGEEGAGSALGEEAFVGASDRNERETGRLPCALPPISEVFMQPSGASGRRLGGCWVGGAGPCLAWLSSAAQRGSQAHGRELKVRSGGRREGLGGRDSESWSCRGQGLVALGAAVGGVAGILESAEFGREWVVGGRSIGARVCRHVGVAAGSFEVAGAWALLVEIEWVGAAWRIGGQRAAVELGGGSGRGCRGPF